VDVDNPLSPALINSYPHPGSTDILVQGNTLFTSGESGLVSARLPFWNSIAIPLSGGSLTSAFDQTAYIFPSGSFTSTVTVEHSYRASFPGSAPGGRIGIGHGFEVSATLSNGASIQPTQPFTLTIQYEQSEVGAAIEDTLQLYHWAGSGWEVELTSEVNSAANTITANPDHLSVWAVFGETRRLFLPVLLR